MDEADALSVPAGEAIAQPWLGLCRRAWSSEFVQKVAQTFTTRMLLMGIGLMTSILVTRILGPEGRGNYAVAVTLGAMGIQFGNLGLHAANTLFVSKDRELLAALLGNTLVISFGFGGLCAAVFWLVFAFLIPLSAPVNGTLLGLSLFWIPFGLGSMLLQNLVLGIHEVRLYNKVELMSKVIGLLLLVLIIGLRIVTPETIFGAGLIALAIGVWWTFRRLQAHLHSFPIPSLDLFKKTILYGIKAYLAALFAFLVLKIDLFMIKYMLGNEEAGFYSVAVALADLLYMLPVVVGSILFPRLSAIQEEAEKWNLTIKVISYLGVSMVIIAIGAILFAESLVGLLYGHNFIPAVPALIWLAPGIVMLSLTSIFSSYIASKDIPISLVCMYFITALVNVIINRFTIYRFGIVGASMSSTFCYGLCLISIFFFARCQHDKSTSDKI
jgi:O-antigen/teichoic acid export membrane protein